MAAPVTLPVEIGGRTFTLSFKFGTIRVFERELGVPLAEAFGGKADSEDDAAALAAKIPLDTWSALFWAALQPAHMMTREGADDLIDAAGLEKVVDWCSRGLAAYQTENPALLDPESDAEQAGNAPAGKAKKGK